MKYAVIGAIASFAAASIASAGVVGDFEWTGSQAIPDEDPVGTSVSITVPSNGQTIVDVNVGIIAQHTWQGDLIVTLSKDGGPTVTLLNRAGDSASGFGFSADNFGDPSTGTYFELDDEAAQPYDSIAGWGTIPDPGIPNVTGAWIPYGAFPAGGIAGLAAFDGLDRSGEWTLTVSDNANGDIGAILGFRLSIVTVPAPGAIGVLALSPLAILRRRR